MQSPPAPPSGAPVTALVALELCPGTTETQSREIGREVPKNKEKTARERGGFPGVARRLSRWRNNAASRRNPSPEAPAVRVGAATSHRLSSGPPASSQGCFRYLVGPGGESCSYPPFLRSGFHICVV